MLLKLGRGRGRSNDSWLTPPELVRALGPFDLDPCVSPGMPWRTARRMVALPDDGLAVEWRGRVWLNPPYSDPLPWVEKFFGHGSGVLLVPARSTETRWGQTVLARAAAVLFLRGRLLFHRADGSASDGKYIPNLLAAAGPDDVRALRSCMPAYPGVLMVRGAKR